MNTKKRIASPSMLVICLLGMGIMVAACAATVCMGADALAAEEAKAVAGAYFAMAAVCAGFALFYLLGMNAVCSLVWVENGILYRRGLLFGHRRSCVVSDIQKLELVAPLKGGRWIYIVDSQPGVYKNLGKHSYICLEDTAANRAFIASFCGRIIRERKQ